MLRPVLTCVVLAAATLAADLAQAAGPATRYYMYNVQRRFPWHGEFYDPAWGGAPVALVVPPTAALQTKWAWGVTNTNVVPIYHQFGRAYPGPPIGNDGGPYGYGYGFYPRPVQPGGTDQFGVYYVRGPW
jgi:hypothetical protein